jgi:hypothetical protein
MSVDDDNKKWGRPKYDFRAARLPQEFDSGIQERAVCMTQRKPQKTEWFRSRPGDQWSQPLGIVEDERRELYALLNPGLYGLLEGVVKPCVVTLCVNRHGTCFVWPAPLVHPDRPNAWHVSAAEARTVSFASWTRMVANQTGGSYRIYTPDAGSPLSEIEPQWPEHLTDFEVALNLAFKDRVIDSADHPVVEAILGRK